MINQTPAYRTSVGPLGGRDNALRPAYVSDNARARFVVPVGRVRDARARELLGGGANYPATSGNEVEYYLNADAFAAMAEAFCTCTQAGHSVTIVAWQFIEETRIPNVSRAGRYRGMTFGDAIRDLAGRGVVVRLLLWARWIHLADYLTNAPSWLVTSNLYVVFDRQETLLGSHHQKIMVVEGSQGLIAFYGGVDVNPDRYNDAHDVHARVRGPAAAQLHRLAKDRWNASRFFSTHGSLLANPAGAAARFAIENTLLMGLPDALARGAEIHDPPAPPRTGHSRLLVTQTVGNPELSTTYTSDIRPMLLSAIRNARRFIYVEDQYFTSQEVAHALVEALPHIQALVVFLPRYWSVEGHSRTPRVNMLRTLANAPAEQRRKIGIFDCTSEVAGNPDQLLANYYVHAKTWIIDDELAIVGSCNANDRGLRTDSEVMVSQVHRIDPPWDSVDLGQPHKLRIELWHRHSGLARWKLVDPIAALYHWKRLELAEHQNDELGRVAVSLVPERNGRPQDYVPWWQLAGEPERDESLYLRAAQHGRVL